MSNYIVYFTIMLMLFSSCVSDINKPEIKKEVSEQEAEQGEDKTTEIDEFAIDFSLYGVVVGAGQILGMDISTSCESNCITKYPPNQSVVLAASPNEGSLFQRWEGACQGSGICIVKMDDAKSVVAIFSKVDPPINTPQIIIKHMLTVSRPSGGRIYSKDMIVDCGDINPSQNKCSLELNKGQVIELFTQNKEGYMFDVWDLACSGNSECTLNITNNLFVSGLFESLPPPDKDPSNSNNVEIICAADFEGNSSDIKGFNYGSLSGGKISISNNTSLNYNNSKGSIRGIYPEDSRGANYVWANCKFPEKNLSELYIEFKAKMPGEKYGHKFLKVFGQQNSGMANTTFSLGYDSGIMNQVSFGDGSSAGNDTTHVINLNGTGSNLIGRSFGVANVKTPQSKNFHKDDWGSEWHHFRFYLKFNSGVSKINEVADGSYYVEIDGEVYVDAKGIFNRHYSNMPIEKVSLFGWTQLLENKSFELWYDDIIISTGGFKENSN